MDADRVGGPFTVGSWRFSGDARRLGNRVVPVPDGGRTATNAAAAEYSGCAYPHRARRFEGSGYPGIGDDGGQQAGRSGRAAESNSGTGASGTASPAG